MIKKTIDLFIETTKKCPICGFYKRVCACAEESQEKTPKWLSSRMLKDNFKKLVDLIRSPKEYFKQFSEKIKMKYHRYMYLHFTNKSDKAHEKAKKHGENYVIHREFRESKIDWNKVEFEGIDIKISQIDWGELEQKDTQTKAEGVV